MLMLMLMLMLHLGAAPVALPERSAAPAPSLDDGLTYSRCQVLKG